MMIDARNFRDALGRFATGVTIVTTLDHDGRPVGLTANSFNSVSLDPPMVLWSLSRRSQNLAVFERAERYAVNVLAVDQRELSDRFARSVDDRFAGVSWRPGTGGVPVLADVAAVFECENETRVAGGDHMIFLGRVAAFSHDERQPLIYHGGRYAALARGIV